jgi:hypothetical protein
MNRFPLLKFPKLPIVSMIAILCVGSILASAQAAPTAGYDLLATTAGTSCNLSSVGLGVVPLQGVPIASALGTADTIMHRPTNTTFGTPQTLLVTALFMKSTSSVEFQGQSADVYVTINNTAGVIPTSVLPQPDSLQPSSGTITISSGGTFNTNFAVNADVILVRAGTSVTNPDNWIAHQPAPTTPMTSPQSTWSSSAPSGYPSTSTFPSGGFYPVVLTDSHKVTYAVCNASNCVSQ